jgi:isoquinoline 1-oxidoreductase beta subunit
MMNKSAGIKRRDFLRVSALASGGLLISMAVPVSNLFAKGLSKVFSPNAFLRIGDDDSILVTLSKVEMGQGVWTTLPMLLAEELDCDWKKIRVEHSPPGTAQDFLEPPIGKSTGGSESTVSQFDIYREAGATARMMLVSAAANRWGVQPESCNTEDGYVVAGDKRVSYGELAGDASKLTYRGRCAFAGFRRQSEIFRCKGSW